MCGALVVVRHGDQHEDHLQRQPFEVRGRQVQIQQRDSGRAACIQGGGGRRQVGQLEGCVFTVSVENHGFHSASAPIWGCMIAHTQIFRNSELITALGYHLSDFE